MLYSFKIVKYGIKYWLFKEFKRIKYKLDFKECCIMGVVINVWLRAISVMWSLG